MGLLESWFGASGQGVGAYTQGQLAQQEEQRKRDLFGMQQQQHDFTQGLQKIQLLEGQGQKALGANNLEGANAVIPSLSTEYAKLGIPTNMKPVVGSPVGGTPAQPARSLAQYGPSPTGAPLGNVALPAQAAVAPHNDLYQDPKTAQTLAGMLGYVAPTPKIETAAPGSLLYHWDAKSRQVVQDGTVPDRAKAEFIPTRAGLYNTRTGQIMAGTEPMDPATKDHFSMVPVTGDDGKTHLVRFNTATGEYGDTPLLGKQPAPRASDQKQNALLLQTAQGLVGKFGGQITSSGIRPVGKPGDTGATRVNGHQTQYGLRYEYEHNGGPLAAVPGTSDHGNGNAVDVFVPAPARAAFEREAANLGLNILSEADASGNHHYHLTAPGALAPVKAPPRAGLRQDPKTGQWFQPREGEVTSVRSTGLGSLEAGSQDATGQAILKILADRKKAGQ